MPKHTRNTENDEEKILMDIEKFGWTVIVVEGTDYLPTFAYTIGLYKNYKHPEIIAFGLDSETLFGTINDIGEGIKSGEKFQIQRNYPELFENSRTEFLKVDPENIEDYFGYAVDFYEDNTFPALELIWTDEKDAFPWDKHYDSDFQFSQPLLDRNMAFKFLEEKNLDVFTTRQFLEDNTTITRVLHDEQGDWYFSTSDSRPNDMTYTTLENMIRTDNTLNELFHLDYGEQALRESRSDIWTKSICKGEFLY